MPFNEYIFYHMFGCDIQGFHSMLFNVRYSPLWFQYFMVIILGGSSANERQRYNVTSPLIGRAHIQNDHWFYGDLFASPIRDKWGPFVWFFLYDLSLQNDLFRLKQALFLVIVRRHIVMVPMCSMIKINRRIKGRFGGFGHCNCSVE